MGKCFSAAILKCRCSADLFCRSAAIPFVGTSRTPTKQICYTFGVPEQYTKLAPNLLNGQHPISEAHPERGQVQDR